MSQWLLQEKSKQVSQPRSKADRHEVVKSDRQLCMSSRRDGVVCFVPFIVVDVTRARLPLSATNGLEGALDVVGEAGGHGNIQLPAVSCKLHQKR